jgi:hypothetical protein
VLDSRQGRNVFLLSTKASEAHPDYSQNCNLSSFLSVKWPGREADHTSPSTADFKNTRAVNLRDRKKCMWCVFHCTCTSICSLTY